MTISQKIMVGFALVILIMVVANGYVLLELRSVSETGRLALTSDVQTIDRAKRMKEVLYDEVRNGQKFLVSGDPAYSSLFRNDVGQFSMLLDSLQSVLLDSLEREYVARIEISHASLIAFVPEVPRPDFPLVKLESLAAGLDESAGKVHSSLDRLIARNQKAIDRSLAAIEQKTHRSIRVALLMFVSALFLAILAAVLIAHTITRPIKAVIKGTEEIARGSFQPISVRSRDEMALLANAVNDLNTKLKALERQRTELMHDIAHELRTPLTTMLTAYYVLLEQRVGHLNPEQLRLLASIRRSIDKLTQFSYDFLDLAKIEAGMMQYQLENTDLVEFVAAHVEEAKLNASGKRISLSFDSSRSPEVLIDRQRFSQVITNLLSNAVKYSREEGSVWVSVHPCGFGARVSIRDNGVGIPPEDLPKIFEKFYRAKSSTNRSGGTGVGLAIVKAVTEAMGGRVHAASTPGVGSTFSVELPAAAPKVDPKNLSGVPKGMEFGHG
jgi:signal transduction histidine kinase